MDILKEKSRVITFYQALTHSSQRRHLMERSNLFQQSEKSSLAKVASKWLLLYDLPMVNLSRGKVPEISRYSAVHDTVSNCCNTPVTND